MSDMAYLLELFYASLAIVALSSAVSVSSFNCTGKGDGVYEPGCHSFTLCKNGISSIVECKYPLVTNTETQSCDQPFNVNTPCGTFRDCSFRDDGKYPDLESRCHWFHTCSFGQFQGHSPCPANLVLNVRLQVCDFPFNVEPPCGTKTS